jgi:hypothetical protein
MSEPERSVVGYTFTLLLSAQDSPLTLLGAMRLLAALCIIAGLVACHRTTATLPPELASRFEAESIARRADDQVFRYTYYSRSTRGNRWEDRDASIIVTKSSVFVHKNGKVGLDLTRASRKANEVRRDGERVIISSGSGQSRVSWSFRPPADAELWVEDIRRVIGERE